MKEKVKKRVKIVFVCTGNTCRSPMAEYIFKDFLAKKRILSRFEVSSAGVFAEASAPMNEFSQETLKNLGIKFKEHRAVQFSERLAKRSDYIICMTTAHKEALDESVMSKSFAMREVTGATDVPDPFGQGLDRYEAAAKYLLYACDDIFKIVGRE